MSCIIRNPVFEYAKRKTQTSCIVTAQLISVLVLASLIVQSLYFLNLTFQACIYPSSVFVQPGLCQTWSETPKTDFLMMQLLCCFTFSSFCPLLKFVAKKKKKKNNNQGFRFDLTKQIEAVTAACRLNLETRGILFSCTSEREIRCLTLGKKFVILPK